MQRRLRRLLIALMANDTDVFSLLFSADFVRFFFFAIAVAAVIDYVSSLSLLSFSFSSVRIVRMACQ